MYNEHTKIEHLKRSNQSRHSPADTYSASVAA